MHRLYTTAYIYAISFISTVILFSIIYGIHLQIQNLDISAITTIGKKDIIKVQINDGSEKNETKEQINNDKENIDSVKTTQLSKWYLKIPSISLEANIAEGTSEETMNIFIGHFEETSKTHGNIGLAAHNRGYPINYFAKLKLLKEGDVIEYRYNDFKHTYIVTSNKIIKDTDWTNLEDTKEDTITLITCVENEPEFRRCVRGKLN